MELKDKLNEYMEQLNCSAKLLAQCSGLSAATISRYRSGERIPEPGSENLSALIDGLAEIASRQQHTELTRETISSTFAALMDQTPAIDTDSLQQNFHLLLTERHKQVFHQSPVQESSVLIYPGDFQTSKLSDLH